MRDNRRRVRIQANMTHDGEHLQIHGGNSLAVVVGDKRESPETPRVFLAAGDRKEARADEKSAVYVVALGRFFLPIGLLVTQ